MATGWLLGTLLALAIPVQPPAPDLSWLPAATTGVRLPALQRDVTDRGVARRRWCDFGRHAQRLAKVPPALDPVFRKPSSETRRALQEIRDSLANPDDYTAPQQAEARLRALVATAEGPPLLRVLLQDPQPRLQLLALRLGAAVVAAHPRLAAFATPYLNVADPERAAAAVELHVRSGCDTAALYALDGFRHPSEAVQLTTLRLVWEVSQSHENLRLADRISQFLVQGHGTPRSRVAALRVLGRLGWLSAGTDVEPLLRDRQPAVAAEALVTLAIVQPGRAERVLLKWLRDPTALKRAAAVRAFAQVFAHRVDLAEKHLRPLIADVAPLPPDLGQTAKPQRVRDVVEEALAYIEL